MDKIIISVGASIGYWTVIERLKNRKCGSPQWLCKCVCGNTKNVIAYALAHNRSNSCGCHKNEAISKGIVRHGHASKVKKSSPEYISWSAMKTRCRNPNIPQYSGYGGRGITICERWLTFENFLEDMGPKPSLNHSIDRIDVNEGYHPSNCKWSTASEQMHNKRVSKNNKSGHMGVLWRSRSNKWEVNISCNKKYTYLGLYSDLETAIRVRKEAELKYWNKKTS